ncbi:acid shock protein [Methanobrevibacter cuticularis]|uniref:Acid shock protein n=1 Tax=Methanobrevibacter cuticularis TaxID=47311 RepID=A0A166CYB8_9EURY|nr:Hsp20/alpha crystallin family protein [Methanobrevibacter cuticularis]KZX14991.1 acid shock protein [Methanobrevibacter cuticularis]
MRDKRTLEKGVADSKEMMDKHMEKGKNVAGKMANDFGKTMDDILVNLKSFQKDFDSKISEYREITPSKIDLDLIDGGENLYVKADLPGVNKEDIDVEIVEQELTIIGLFGDGNQKEDSACNKENCEFLIKGRKYGPARRSIRLPTKIKENECKAEFSNGVLLLELPKVEVKKLKVDIK